MDVSLVAKFLAVPSGFILGTYNAVLGQNAIPHLYSLSPSISAPIFARIYQIGSRTITPIAITAILSYSYLAYNGRPAERKLYAASAVLMLGTLPVTQVIMGPGIGRVIEISRDGALMAKPAVQQEVTALLKTWVVQNSFRASMHLSAGILGLYAILSAPR